MLPLMVDVRDRKIVIVGGGNIAFRKLSVLLTQGASITVISPDIIEGMKELYEAKQIEWLSRKVVEDDLTDAFLIVAATNDKEVNAWVAEVANAKQLVNIASAAELGNIQMPSFQQQGKLTISVSTDGASPILAKKLCQQLFEQFDESFFLQLEEQFAERQKIKASRLNQGEKKQQLLQLVEQEGTDTTI